MELLILLGIALGIAKACSSSRSNTNEVHAAEATDFGHDPDYYDFEYRKVGNEWRAYIPDQPSYRGRATDLHSTHRHRDANGYYVCWSDPIRTEEECREIARQWAKCTDRYIEDGEEF